MRRLRRPDPPARQARRSVPVTRRGWWLFVGLALIWGIPYLLIKVAVRELTPASLVFVRTAIGAALLLPVAIGRGNLRALLPRWRPVVLFTVVELAIPWLLLSDAERRVSSSLAGLVVASVPLHRRALRPHQRWPRAPRRTPAHGARDRPGRGGRAPRARPRRRRRLCRRRAGAGRPRLRARPGGGLAWALRPAHPRRGGGLARRSAPSSTRRSASPSFPPRCRRRR